MGPAAPGAVVAAAAALTAAVIVLSGGIGWVANDREKRRQATAHMELGNSLGEKGDVDGAIAEYREAIRLNKNDGQPNATSAKMRLQKKGQFASDALPHFRLGHQNPRRTSRACASRPPGGSSNATPAPSSS